MFELRKVFLPYPRMKWATAVLGCGLTAWAAAAVIASSMASAQPPKGPPPPGVIVSVAQQRALAPTAWYTGSVQSRHNAQVPAEVDGRLVFVTDVGTEVVAGDVLARLDDTLAGLQKDEFEAEVSRVSARLDFLARESERLRRLASQNAAAETQLEETESERDRSRSELAATRARLEQAKVRLARSVVKAPFSGVVVERIANMGEWVDSGDPVVRLIDRSALEVVAKVPLWVLNNVRPGVRVTTVGGEKKTGAVVRTTVPVGDTLSRLVDVRLDFTQPEWTHGMVVRVAVPTAPSREVVAVPRDALVLRRAGTSVFRINGEGKAEKVDVETGVASGPWIEINGAVRPGDRVVVRGGERLRSGQVVNIIEEKEFSS